MNHTFTDPQPGEFYDKYDLSAELYPGITVETALPQDWVNACAERGHDVRPHVVWAYPQGGSIYGHPLPITEEGVYMLGRLAMSVGG